MQSPTLLQSSHECSVMISGFPSATSISEDIADAQCVFEAVQVGLVLQGRRHEACLGQLAHAKAHMSNLARLTVNTEESMEKERQERQATLSSVSRQVEDTLLTCEALRRGQEHLNLRLERLESPFQEAQDRAGSRFHELRQKVSKLRGTALEPARAASQLSQRLRSIEPAVEESRDLWLETLKLRASEEHHDLQVAAVQGQIDALTKLVRERLRSSQASDHGAQRQQAAGVVR